MNNVRNLISFFSASFFALDKSGGLAVDIAQAEEKKFFNKNWRFGC